MKTLKDMENYIVEQQGLMTLSFIEDTCHKRVVELGRAVMVEPNRYVAKDIVRSVVDKDLYAQRVIEHYNTLVRQEPKKRTKREKGRNATQKEAFELIFRNLLDHRTDDLNHKGKNKRNYIKLGNIDPETQLITKGKFVSNMTDLLEQVKHYNYFSANMFYTNYTATKDDLRHLVSIVLDFDLDKHKVAMTKEELHDLIKKSIKVAPSLIWDSKTPGNYQALILIGVMAGTDKSVHLYEAIVKEMVDKLQYADNACISANHLYSVPRSNDVRKIRFYHDVVYDIKDQFRWLLDERDQCRAEQLENGNVADFTKHAIRKHPAIDALFNGQILPRTRNNACFTLALVMRSLGYSESECEEYITNEWYPKVRNRSVDKADFTTKERDKVIQKAYSGKFKSFHSDYVTMVTGMECDLKGYFGRYQNQGINVLNNAEKVIEFLRQQDNRFEGNLQDIADAIGAKKRTLERVMRELREGGIISYQSAKGRGKTAVYELQEKYQEEPKPVEKPNNVKVFPPDLQTELQAIEEDARRNPEKYPDRSNERDWWFPIEEVDEEEILAVMRLFEKWNTA
jgi:hypothetical protein